jgi:hypothetical protein
VGLNRYGFHVNSTVVADVVSGPQVNDLALSELVICSSNLNEVEGKRVSLLIIPVDGNNSEEAAVVDLGSSKDLDSLRATALDTDSLPS